MDTNLESKWKYVPIIVLSVIFLWFWYTIIKLNFFRGANGFADFMIILPLFFLIIVGILAIIEYKNENSNPATHTAKSELLFSLSIILLVIPILTIIIIILINNVR